MLERTGPVDETGLPLTIDHAAEEPLHEQLERSVREAVRAGRLEPGTRLPSTRGLAAELGISRGVVSSAYDQLAAEGYLEIRQGASPRVARSVRPARPRAPARSMLPSFPYDLRPGLPDLAGFPAAPVAALGAGGVDRGAARRHRHWATHAERPSCARRWRATSAAPAGRRWTPSTSWSPPASARRSR